MTYRDDNDGVVPVLKLRLHDDEGKTRDYHELSCGESKESEDEIAIGEEGNVFCWEWRWSVVWYWAKLALVILILSSLVAVFMKWIYPFLMDKEVIPIINWETTTFSNPVLAVLVFATVSLFPSLLLPSTPSMWVAGMEFGYGYGFLLIISAVSIGVSLPYFIGSIFLGKIQKWVENYPKKAAFLRAAGEGIWWHQFKTVTLIRISPFPYILYNYCAIATKVSFGAYLAGSLLGMLPDIFVAIYTGIFIKTLADASYEQHSVSASQIMLNLFGFCATVVVTVVITVYAKRKLKALQDEPLLE